jgi:hypothetical protein
VRIVHAATVRSALQRLHAHARLTEIIINAWKFFVNCSKL